MNGMELLKRMKWLELFVILVVVVKVKVLKVKGRDVLSLIVGELDFVILENI